jgi:hypothetical protein
MLELERGLITLKKSLAFDLVILACLAALCAIPLKTLAAHEYTSLVCNILSVR